MHKCQRKLLVQCLGFVLWITESASYCSTGAYQYAFPIRDCFYTQNFTTSGRAKNPQANRIFVLTQKHSRRILLSVHKDALMSELVAYVDGGSLGNPGPSGIGVVIDGCESGPI